MEEKNNTYDGYALKTNDKKLSHSRCLKYQNVTVFNDSTKKPMTGVFEVSSGTLRFLDGLLDGGRNSDGQQEIPAYEANDGHVEYWDHGVIHRDGKPAVISDFGNWEEWWYHGNLLMIKSGSRIIVDNIEI